MARYLHETTEEEQKEREAELAAWRRSAAAELDAMSKCFELLAPLAKDSQGRALKWLEARLDNRPYYGEPPF
jgi:hypothetical protein